MLLTLSAVAATGYGLSDFTGGLAARRGPVLGCLLQTQAVGLVLLLGTTPLVPGRLSVSGFGWAAAAGLCGLIGCVLLYRLMSSHPLSSVTPLTAVVAALAPVVVGVAAGDRLSATAALGVAVGLVAVALIGVPGGPSAHPPAAWRTVGLAVGAGAGFGGFFVCVARAGDAGAGMLPLLVARVVAVSLALIVVARRKAWAPRRLIRLAGLAGATDAAADVCYLFAARDGLSVAGVVTAFYPGVTVACALVLLGERLSRRSVVGLGLSAVAVALIAA